MQKEMLWHTFGAYSKFLRQQIAEAAAEVSCEKALFKSFEKFTGKHLRRSLFLNKIAGLRPGSCNSIKKNSDTNVIQ